MVIIYQARNLWFCFLSLADLGMDHSFFKGGGGGLGNFRKKKSCSDKTAEKKIVQGEPWGEK